EPECSATNRRAASVRTRSRPAMTICIPLRARPTAVWRPMPELAPVTSATFSAMLAATSVRGLDAIHAESPAASDLMADRERRRQCRKPRDRVVRSRPVDHGAHLLALEPAHFGEFIGVDRDLFAQRLGETPHHQARREWPGL